MKIILFRGRPGTGKTTLSNALAKNLNIPVLRKDDIYDVVSGFISEHSNRNQISYQTLYKILTSNAQSGATLILDYPFQHEGDFGIIKKWCSDADVTLKSILVTCSNEALWTQRLRQRAENPTPNQLITDFNAFKKLYGSMHLNPEADELLVDTVISLADNIDQINQFVLT